MKDKLVIFKGIFLIMCGTRIIAKIIKMISGRTNHSRIGHPRRRTCMAPIIFSSRIVHHFFMRIIRSISIKFDFNFDPVNQNRKEIKFKCTGYIYFYCSMRNGFKNKIRKCQRQQMTPNEFAKFFKVFFINNVNFNPFCFGKVKRSKSEQQNRRIEEGEGLIGQKNRGANTNHQNNKHITPHKKNNILKHFNHDEFSNLSYVYCTTKKVKVL
jgi:hypothetical protein